MGSKLIVVEIVEGASLEQPDAR
jgi:hypothetical protein